MMSELCLSFKTLSPSLLIQYQISTRSWGSSIICVTQTQVSPKELRKLQLCYYERLTGKKQVAVNICFLTNVVSDMNRKPRYYVYGLWIIAITKLYFYHRHGYRLINGMSHKIFIHTVEGFTRWNCPRFAGNRSVRAEKSLYSQSQSKDRSELPTYQLE